MTIANDIQDAMMDVAKKVGAFKNLFDTPMETIQASDLPFIAVFLVRESMMATSGTEMAADPEFWHDIDIGVQAAIVSPDAEQQRKAIVDALTQLDTAMLTNLRLLQLIQNITRIDRHFNFERKAELPAVQFSALYSVRAWSRWPPYIPDDYLRVRANLAWPIGGNLASLADTPIAVRWDISQTIPSPPPDPY